MGTELVGACIFCASQLLGIELTPRMGLGAEIGFAYATMARRYQVTPERVDGSDITPKFLLIGLGNSRPAQDGLGAGTPAAEWRARIAFASSHDEQQRKPTDELEGITATGTGRYENFLVVGRFSLGPRDSIEVGVEDRSNKSTDLVNIGGEAGNLSEQRSITASRVDLGAGWRHRWKGLEAQAGFRWSRISGYNSSASSFQKASGAILGGEAEIRWRQGRWTALLRGESSSGKLDVHRESAPAFADRDAKLPASLAALRLGIGYSWPRTELFLSGTYSREHLPFVAIAPLGTETVAFGNGFDPDSLNKEFFGDLTFRYAFSPVIRVRVSIRMAWGDETVTLTDSAGVLPSQTLDVQRRGFFGGGLHGSLGDPEVVLFLGADFAIGAPR